MKSYSKVKLVFAIRN